MGSQQTPPANITIIKRKKVVKGEGHHGGAWKVAYADFVTAMMAFFLLMWLLNATTEDQRKGIADYFSPTVPISRISGGGSDGLNGSSIMTEDNYARMGTGASRDQTVANPYERNPDDKPITEPVREKNSDQEAEQAITDQLESLKESLENDGRQLSDHLLIKMSAEGIVLEITDSENAPLFPVGRSDPSNLLTEMLGLVATTFQSFENDIKIVGHTDSLSYRDGASYDNWNLSADRANAARKLLIADGMDAHRILEVSGKADTDPLVKDSPDAAQNRRISITILTH
ncbi:MAG: flagellar motor protein MotB [Hyphomonas sp.]|nr:OmpA family protein [Hyphomonas sp.]